MDSVLFHTPSDDALHAIGRLAITHTRLLYISKVFLGHVEGLNTTDVIREKYGRWGFLKVRDKLKKIAINDKDFLSFIAEAEELTDQRNSYVHMFSTLTYPSGLEIYSDESHKKSLDPAPENLNTLANEIEELWRKFASSEIFEKYHPSQSHQR